ncbi:hypothetical protein ACFYTF_04585 [Nocardia thailandica]|uniref:GNAT family N-acetyltransferase n=1 Tax=Nocardia thailandica TaxID=257275 RepID=A0ABW6PIA1_9NOCA
MDHPTRLVLADVARAQRLRLLDDRMHTLGRHSRGERRVRTAEGSRKFGVPIGELIRRKLRRKKDREQEQPRAESADPGQREPAPVQDLFGMDDDQITEQLAALNGRYGDRLDMAVSRAGVVDRGTPDERVMVEANITDPDTGMVVGEAMWGYHRGPNGELVASHELLAVTDGFKDTGLGHAYFARLGPWYQQSGVDRLSIYASLEDGGYAWARAEFEWDRADPRKFERSMSSVRGRLSTVRADATPADQARIDAMLARLDAGPDSPEFPRPVDLARMSGDDTRLGRTVMRGSSWTGTMGLR